MRVSSVIDLLPYGARAAIMSHIAFECTDERNQLDTIRLPSKYARYNVMVGADLADATEEKIEEMRDSDITSSGWLYGKRISKLEYAPEKLSFSTFFF